MSAQLFHNMNNTGIIILAAGSSSRFGGIKQLLHFNNKTLIQHIIDEAVDAGAEPVIVVTGAHANEVSKEIKNKNVDVIFNEDWQLGMASGIVAGLSQILLTKTDIANVIVAVCDQPFVTSALLKQLYNAKEETGKDIIACTYADTEGTPVLFAQKYFESLLLLKGDEGAKKILKSNPADVATISFPQGNIDIDTRKDYEDLLDRQKHVL